MLPRIVSRLAVACAAALIVLCVPLSATAQIAVSITVAPPGLPVYEQPPIPAPGYIWTPGYWAYGPDGYYWVPGTWVEPPAVGLLWTPGYWGWNDGAFVWTDGYWGPTIGFYGGVDYGFGYPGHGYAGGEWRGGQFYYNRSVTNVTNVEIHNVYNQTVVNNVTVNKVSYVGGPGGLTASPTAEEREAARGPHTPPTRLQAEQRSVAGSRPELRAAVNHGKPQIAATSKPGEFSTHVVAAREAGAMTAAQTRGGESRPSNEQRPGNEQRPDTTTAEQPAPTHARDLPRMPAPAAAPAQGADQAEARRQADLQSNQEQERAALAQQQDKEHAEFNRQGNQDKQAFQAMEQKHQQQTQQLQQRQAAERNNARNQRPQREARAPQKPDDRG
jgi:hypothetical protein